MEMGESEMTPEIVPCPFCGSTRMEYEAKFRTDPVVRGDIDELILSCALCHRSYDVTDEPIIQSREEMIALWNKIVSEKRRYRWVKEECCSEWAHMYSFYKKPHTYPTPSITNEDKPMNSCPFCGKPFVWRSVPCERVTVEDLDGEIVEDWEVVDK